jgi:hypothetical protein
MYSNDNENVGVIINTGSISPYGGKNPTFSVIELDAEYLMPLSVETYWANLTEANIRNNP